MLQPNYRSTNFFTEILLAIEINFKLFFKSLKFISIANKISVKKFVLQEFGCNTK